MREEKLLGLRAGLQVGGRGFGKFSTIFWNFFGKFLQFFGKFLRFFGKFLQFFGKFLQKFSQFFSTFAISYDFSENSRPQSVTVQPGSRHYCKFTIKFTIKFTPILIKILQSTKFEGSHFHNLLQILTDFPNLMPTSQTFSPLCALCPSPPCFLDHSSAVPKVPTAVPPLATSEVCGQYEGL